MILNNKTVYNDEYIENILSQTNSIAIVGLSADENRPSNFAARYLQNRGFKIIPVNPITKEKKILEEKVYKDLLDLVIVPDMIDIFIKNENVLPVVEKALSIRPKTIWLQLGIISKAAERKVKKAKINFVMDRCPKIEYARLSGELSWNGINSKVITSRKIKFNQ